MFAFAIFVPVRAGESSVLLSIAGLYEIVHQQTGSVCAVDIYFNNAAPGYVEHDSIAKNGVNCSASSDGKLVLEEWPLVASKLQGQIQAQPIPDADKREGHNDIIASYDALMARGQDSQPYVCGGVGSMEGGRDIYTFAKNISNTWLVGKLAEMHADEITDEKEANTIYFQVWTPDESYDALSPIKQTGEVQVIPLGGCWYRKVTQAQAMQTFTTGIQSTYSTQTISSTRSPITSTGSGGNQSKSMYENSPSTTSDVESSSPSIDSEDNDISNYDNKNNNSHETNQPSIENAAPERIPNSRSCFPGYVTVALDNGENRRMDELRIGDRVLVGPETYSTVFMFTHIHVHGTSQYVRLRTASGAAVTLTPNHYLYVSGDLELASQVQVGDELVLGSGISDIVVAVDTFVAADGLFNPQTVHGDIVVGGIKASTYTITVKPHIAHALLAPFRASFCVLESLFHASTMAAILMPVN